MSAVIAPVWKSLSSERFDPYVLVQRVGGDMGLLRELADIFAAEYPRMLREIELSARRNDRETLRKVSHKLKGSLLQLAAPAACEAAANLEISSGETSLERTPFLIEELRKEVALLMENLTAMISVYTPENGEVTPIG